MSLLEVKNICIDFETRRGLVRAVDRLSLHVEQGETLGIVGESGCGKSITSLALMGLLAPNARVSAESVKFDGKEILTLSESQKQNMRGKDVAMIFQDPMTSLNPCFTVGYQIKEALEAHQGGSKNELHNKAIELMKQVGIPDPERRLENFPHQLSGGMSQRVMIAMAIACNPKLLIADEPTTALDVTIQSQILQLLKSIQKERKMALILITHDIGVVSQMADRIMVMYAGQCAEVGHTQDVIFSPKHPYTKGLLESLPSNHSELEDKTHLPSLTGLVPDLLHRPEGCQFHPRCKYVQPKCRKEVPALYDVAQQKAKCFYPVGVSS